MELIKFIVNPKDKLGKDKSIYQTIYKFSLLTFLIICLGAIALILSQTLQNFDIIPKHIKEFKPEIKSIRSSLLFSIILFPILEEFAFRLYLKRNNINVFVSSFLITHMICSAFIFNTNNFSLEQDGFLRILIDSFIAFISLYVYRKELFKLKFNFLFYFSVLLFGLVHIYNHDYSNPKVLLFALIICLPQIIAGILFGYTRVKYGIIGSIILHILVNGLPQLIL